MKTNFFLIRSLYEQLVRIAAEGIRLSENDQLYSFVITCACKVWSQNKAYAPVYLEAMNACCDAGHEGVQLKQAISMMGAPERFPSTPDFFCAMVNLDKQKNTDRSGYEALPDSDSAYVTAEFTAQDIHDPEGERAYKVHLKTIGEDTLESHMQELKELIGLEAVKDNVTDLINLTRVQAMRNKLGLKNAELSMHMVFTGNPGTGKTTVAGSLRRSISALVS